MKCPKCQSENVNIQIINEVKMVTKHHGIIWWLLIGWWWIPIKWLFLTIPALLFKIFHKKDKKTINKTKKIAVCQNCGNTFSIK